MIVMQIKLKNSLIIIFVLFLLVSCSNKRTMNAQEYINFFKKEGKFLSNSESISGIKYTVFIETPELLVLRNNNFNEIDPKTFGKEIENYRKSIYCSFVIKDEEGAFKVKQLIYNKPDYFKLVGFANTQLQSHLKMIINDQTVFCTVCHLEPPSSINPELRIAIAFDYDSGMLYGLNSQGCEVVFDDEIFNNGIIKFSFDKNDLGNLPELKI